jgi:hypothetical protein
MGLTLNTIEPGIKASCLEIELKGKFKETEYFIFALKTILSTNLSRSSCCTIRFLSHYK